MRNGDHRAGAAAKTALGLVEVSSIVTGSPSHELRCILDRQRDNPMDRNKTYAATSSSWAGSAARLQSAFVCLRA